MPPPIHICIRRTLPWHDEAAVVAGLIPHFRPKVALWNATLTMPYHLFRHRLTQIAQLSLGRVQGALRSAIDEVPRGHLVVPMDDDDWLAPELVDRLRQEHDPAARGYLWRRHVVELPPRLRTGLGWLWARVVGPPPDPPTCKTNNYAVPSEPAMRPLLMHHRAASDYFDAHPSEVKRVPASLAIQNRNLASQTALSWKRAANDRDELVIRWEKYRKLYASLRLPAEVAWARPYVEMMDALMGDVRVR